MEIRVPKKRSSVVKYARVFSESDTNKEYTVVKKRYTKYVYICNCPDYMFRGRSCKHIRQFKTEEKNNKRI